MKICKVGFDATNVICLLVLSAFVMMFVTGCSGDICHSKDNPYHHQIGSTSVSVLSVIPWEEVKDELRPEFELTAKDAVSKVVPNTMAMESRILNYLQASAAVGAEYNSPKSITSETSKSAMDLSLSSDGIINKDNIGTEPMLEYMAANSLYQEVKLIENCIDYAANTRSAEEKYDSYIVRMQVSMMPNKRGESYDAYVNLSFFNESIRPSLVSSPKDASEVLTSEVLNRFKERLRLIKYLGTSDKSFSNIKDMVEGQIDEIEEKILSSKDSRQEKIKSLNESIDNIYSDLSGDPNNIENRDVCNFILKLIPILNEFKEEMTVIIERQGNNTCKIVPLLVTDSLEGTLRAQTTDTIRQILFSVMAYKWGLDLNNIQEKLDSVIGKELNSTLTIARISDNTLRVRLGAMNQPGKGKKASNYAMVPRTHNISLLVLVPKDGNEEIGIMSKSSFVQSETGKEADAGFGEAAKNYSNYLDKNKKFSYDEKLKEYKDVILETDTLESLSYSALTNDLGSFRETLRTVFKKQLEEDSIAEQAEGQSEEEIEENKNKIAKKCEEDVQRLTHKLWAIFTEDVVGSKWHFVNVDLPKSVTTYAPEGSQTVLLLDDKKSTTATLYGGKDLGRVSFTALLTIKESNDENNILAANSIEVSSDGRQAKLTFPSIAKYFKNANIEEKGLKLKFEKEVKPDDSNEVMYGCKYVGPGNSEGGSNSDSKPVSLKAFPNNNISSNDGKGLVDLQIQFQFAKSPAIDSSGMYYLTSTGASIDDTVGDLDNYLTKTEIDKEIVWVLDTSKWDSLPICRFMLPLCNLKSDGSVKVSVCNKSKKSVDELELGVVPF